MKLTDEEIIKVLECCDTREWCNDCPLKDNDYCKDVLSSQALDLINRQKAEIDILNHNLKCVKDHKEKLIEQSKSQRAEIERYKGVIKILENDVKTAKFEAYKEFAERLKERATGMMLMGEKFLEVDVDDIDNLLKEMTGGEQ